MSSILGGDAPQSDSNIPVSRSSRLPGIIMMVLVVLLIGATGYLYYQLNQTRTEVAQMRDQVLDEISKIHETTAVTTQTSRRSVESLKADVDAARRQAGQLAGQAQEDGEKQADEIGPDLRKNTPEQAARVTAVSAEVGQVKDQTVAANSR